MQTFTLIFFYLLAGIVQLHAQRAAAKLQFVHGQTITITMEIKNTIAQQAGTQAIDFSVNGSVTHHYKVINAMADNTILHHELERLKFQFQGMGQKRSFDSDNKNDKGSSFRKQFEEILGKNYDLVIDAGGNTIRAIPEKITWTSQDERLVIITDMLKDLTGIVYPPKKGTGSFFKVFPGYETGVGDSWTDTTANENGGSSTVNNVSAVTDSTIIVDFKTISATSTRSEMMGTQAKTNLNHLITGTIIIDRRTGIIREKKSETESSGITEAMGGTLPISGKTSIIIRVN